MSVEVTLRMSREHKNVVWRKKERRKGASQSVANWFKVNDEKEAAAAAEKKTRSNEHDDRTRKVSLNYLSIDFSLSFGFIARMHIT